MPNGNGRLKYVFDIDGTICTQEPDYSSAKPKYSVINIINRLYDEGNHIVFFTARGYETGVDWEEITLNQLQIWGVKYHKLLFGKPSADIYIDDKACNVSDFDSQPSTNHLTAIDKCWGKEYLLDITPAYAMKKLVINKGHNISLQYHEKKRETWHIVKGEGIARLNDREFDICQGDTIKIPANTIHQVKATADLIIIESSTTELDDVVRIRKEF